MKNNYWYSIPVLIFITGIYFFVNFIVQFEGIDEYFQEVELNSNNEINLLKETEYQVYFESKKMHLYDVDSLKIDLKLVNRDTIKLSLPSGSLTMNSNYTIYRRKGILIGDFESKDEGKYQGTTFSNNRFDKTAKIIITQPFMGRIFQQVMQAVGIAFLTIILLIISFLCIYVFLKKKKKNAEVKE